MLKLNRLLYSFRETKKAKIYKKPFYEAIPHLHKPHYMDIHEGYQKRTRQEVKTELDNLEFDVQVKRCIYDSTDPQV